MAKRITFTKGYRPKCPVCGEPLEMPFPAQQKGMALCPSGQMYFAFEQELDEVEMVKDIHGNLTKGKKWKLTGEDKH